MLDLVSKLEDDGEICHRLGAISDPVVVAGVADAQGRGNPPLYLLATNYAFFSVVIGIADLLQALIKLVKGFVDTVPPRFWSWFLTSEESISHKVNVLNEVAFLRRLKLRVFNDTIYRNVSGRFPLTPSAILAWNWVINFHLSHKANVVIFFPLVAYQVAVATPLFHRSVDPVQKSLEGLKLIIRGVRHVKKRNTHFARKPLRHAERAVKDLSAFVASQLVQPPLTAPSRKKLRGVKFKASRDAVYVTQKLAPDFQTIKGLVPGFTWNA